MNRERDRRSNGPFGLSYRMIAGIVLVLLVVLFIALNRDETEVSFVAFSARTDLWTALTLAAAGGFVAGFLLGRQRYRV